MIVLLLFSVASTTMLTSQCSCPGNILTNGGFESGATGWESSTSFYASTGYQQCGSLHNGALDATFNSGWVWQEQSAIPGASYFVQVYAGTHSPSFDHKVKLAFYDANHNYLTAHQVQVDHVVSSGSLQLYTLQKVAPANAAFVRFEAYAQADYLKIDEVCMTANDITSFDYGCNDGRTVTLHPVDNNNQLTSSITIPNSNQVFEYVVEIVYKGTFDPGTTIFVNAGGNTYPLTRVIVDGSSSNEKVWRGRISGNPSTISYTHPGTTSNSHQLQSMLVYAFRNTGGNGSSVSGTFTAVSGYHQTEHFDISIPQGSAPRNARLDIPLSEVTYDCRILNITVQPKSGSSNVGSATTYRFVGDPDLLSPCCIEIVEVYLDAIPANANSINISIDSPTGSSSGCPDSGASQNGQSYVIAGALTVTTDCNPTCEEDLTCTPCTRDVSNTVRCVGGAEYQTYLTNNLGHSVTLATNGPSTWEECETEGTARYTGAGIYNTDHVTFDVYFSGRTTTPPAGSPKSNNCGTANTSNWVYYDEICGTMTSADHGTFDITRRGEAFQVGDGANITGPFDEFGASCWFNVSGGNGYYVSGDINLMLSESCGAACDNVTNGGTIAADQHLCGASADPATLTNVTLPSGGSGAREYLWLRTTDLSIPVENWEQVPNSNTATFNPPVITHDTWYIRCARREGCDAYNGESNIIYLRLTNPAISDIHVGHVTSCGANDGFLNIDPDVEGGPTALPFTVEYTYNGQTFTAGPFSDLFDNFIDHLSGGTYSNITLIDDNGCSVTWPNDIHINGPSPTPLTCESSTDGGFTYFDEPDCAVTVCEGESLIISVNPNGLASYTWSGPNGFSFSDNTSNALISHSITLAQDGTYSVIAVDHNGCESTQTIHVNVDAQPDVTNITSQDPACGGSDGFIEFSFTDNASRTQLEFSIDGGV